MAQYYTDFNVDTIGAINDDVIVPSSLGYHLHQQLNYLDDVWGNDDPHVRFSIKEIGGVNVFEHNVAATDRRSALLYGKNGAMSDFDITAKMYLTDLLTSGLTARGSAGFFITHTNRGYVLRCSGGKLQIGRYSAGSSTIIKELNYVPPLNTWIYLRFQGIGADLKGKAWTVGDAEPAWMVEVASSTIAFGYPGLFAATSNGNSTYWKDWNIQGTGIEPVGWTHKWGERYHAVIPYLEDDVAATGGKVLRLYNPTGRADRKFYAWTDVGAAIDMEVRARMKTSNKINSVQYIRLRAAGGDEDLFDFGESGYALGSSSTGGLTLQRYRRGSFVALMNVGYTITADTYFNVRFRATGIDLKVKVWDDGAEEPAGWNIEYTDVTASYPFATLGWVGVGSVAAGGDTQTFDFFGVGTNGDSAPEEAV